MSFYLYDFTGMSYCLVILGPLGWHSPLSLDCWVGPCFLVTYGVLCGPGPYLASRAGIFRESPNF